MCVFLFCPCRELSRILQTLTCRYQSGFATNQGWPTLEAVQRRRRRLNGTVYRQGIVIVIVIVVVVVVVFVSLVVVVILICV